MSEGEGEASAQNERGQLVSEPPPCLVPEGCGSMPSDRFSKLTAPLTMPNVRKLQDDILKDDVHLDAFITTVSGARFNRYMKDCDNDKRNAVALYHANAKISQSLYLPIQIWEVALRNKLNGFLIWKYGPYWPYSDKFFRTLTHSDRDRLKETKERQERKRKTGQAQTDTIVADLSAGFWVSLFTRSYEIPFIWRYNLARIFSSGPMTRDEASSISDGLLDLRNRVAHHEPIYHLELSVRRTELGKMLQSLCPHHHAYVEFACTFSTEWQAACDILAQGRSLPITR